MTVDGTCDPRFAGERISGSQRLLQDGAPGDQRYVTAVPEDERCVERQGLAIVLDLAFRRSVEARRLEEHHRIGIADGR